MTKLRALHGALVCGAAALAIGATANAGVANYTIDPESSQSSVDNACVGALPGATGEDCTYNQSNPGGLPPGSPWIGPVRGGGYYLPGTSPFPNAAPGTTPLPAAPVPDANNARLAVTGTLIIDDINDTGCDGDDTIEGRFELEAGTRTFSGGPGTWAEETWLPGTVAYIFPESVPDFQNSVPAGCEYIFGDKGFPELIQTLGSFNGVQTYPADLEIGADPIDPNDGEQDAWAAPEPSGIGVGRFEASDFDGNNGVAVTLDEAAFLADDGNWKCVDNFGDVSAPTAEVSGGQCTFGPNADGTPCTSAGSNFCGVRGIGDPDFIPATTPDDGKGQENWIVKIVVAPNGDIIEGRIFANNESVVFATPPAPTQNNSWDGPLIDFTAKCLDCSIAKDDTYNFVTDTNDVVPLAFGANDDTNGELNASTTTVTIAPGPTRGVCPLTGDLPGAITQIGCDYDSNDAFATAGVDTFTYTIDDGVTNPVLGLTATVTVNVETDDPPVANAYTITFDSQGVDPVTLRNTTDVLTEVADNDGGNNPAISVGAASSGTTSINGSEVTYAANADFFSGMDTFTYTIDDDNFMSPGVTAQSATGMVTVDIPNVVPTASDVTAEVEAGANVEILATITAGNGTVAQHTVDGACDEGDIVVNSVGLNGALLQVSATYTAPEGFSGEDTCTYTVTDENGAGDAADGVVTITVTESGIVIKLPGAGSALGPLTLALLPLIPLLRSRRSRHIAARRATRNSGVK